MNKNFKKGSEKLNFDFIKLVLFGVVFLFLLNFVNAENSFSSRSSPDFSGGTQPYFGVSSNIQIGQPSFYSSPGYSSRRDWVQFSEKDCRNRKDFILMIPPGGCSPSVVRSDLLEEQEVAVFCKVVGVQINPLIDVSRIRSIRFKPSKDKKYKSALFYPAKAYINRRNTFANDAIVNEIGYLRIIVPRYASEKDMPDFIKDNLTAVITYDVDNAWGVGEQEFYSSELDDKAWNREYMNYGFWNGKGFLRVEEIGKDFVKVSLYRDFDTRITRVNLKKGERSRTIYLGGYYCAAGLNLRLLGFDSPQEKVLFNVDDQNVWVTKGSRFLDGQCVLRDIYFNNDLKGVRVQCGSESIKLNITKGEHGIIDDKTLSNDVKTFYEKAIDEYEIIDEFYSKVVLKNSKLMDPSGAIALYKASELAGKLELQKTQISYLKRIVEKYPDSNLAKKAGQDIKFLENNLISSESKEIFYLYNLPHKITLLNIDVPKYEDLGIELKIDGKIIPAVLNKKYNINSLNFVVKDIKKNGAKIQYNFNSDTDSKKSRIVNLKLGKTEKLTKKISVTLRKINFKESAVIKVEPSVRGTRSEVNLSFGLGIEKRAIKLSPEKTKDMIKKLNKQIKTWGKVNDNLGKVVKGMKGACFATAATLTVKNFLSGLSGEAMARHEVMTSKNGWNKWCKNNIKEYGSVEACLLAKNSEIEKDVQIYQKEIEKENELMKKIQKKVGTNNQGIYDINKIEEKYFDSNEVFKKDFESAKNIEISLNGEIKKLSDFVEFEDVKKYGDIESSKDIHTSINILQNKEIPSDSRLKAIAKDKLEKELGYVKQQADIQKNLKDLSGAFSGSGVKAIGVLTNEKEIVQEMDVLTKNDKKLFGDNCQATHGFLLAVPSTSYSSLKGKKILVGLKKISGKKNYEIVCAVDSSCSNCNPPCFGNSCSEILQNVEDYYRGHVFVMAERGYYNNPIRDSEAKVEYFESGGLKGNPALVPFDKRNGWYVAAEPILSGFGKPFDKSGRPVNYWICNVGKDGMIDFKQGDKCRLYNVGTGQDLGFMGLSPSDSRRLVRDAENALLQASRQYGKKSVIINGEDYVSGVAEDTVGGKCSDFMSPVDCNIMFNVCDPVLCPASRCDFGGQYRVANVVQSGIIGSLLLCLPNAQEGIAIPICLTGVHAGIDSFLSILNSTSACLQESLDTGRNIGICDQIKSVYLCEFFWKQAVPLMDVFIPKLFEGMVGQGARGGGEYLTVQSAWDNMQNSVDYFQNQYATSAMQAFNMRSTAEIGGDVCSMFVSARYPNSADFFENLVEPDSPPQYTGWFEENVMNTAEVPPRSHYKVYYHIYAGKDRGVSYIVYLKGVDNRGNVRVSPTLVVNRGFIPKGQQVDISKDLQAVSGYKQLCIGVNGQEECGFSQVSTSFALDYLSDMYVKEQVSEKITSTKGCVSGTPSSYNAINPNIQAGAENMMNPEIYKKGVIRVCSSDNPGAQTEPGLKKNSRYDRWKKVGYCDTKEIGCWLDTESVKDVLSQNKEVMNSALENVDTNYLKDSIEKENYMDEQKAIAVLKNADDIIKELEKLSGTSGAGGNSGGTKQNNNNKISQKMMDYSVLDNLIKELNKLSEYPPTNSIAVQALLKKAEIYSIITNQLNEESEINRKNYVYFCPDSEIEGYKQICAPYSDYSNMYLSNFYVKDSSIYYILDSKNPVSIGTFNGSVFIIDDLDKISGSDDKGFGEYLSGSFLKSDAQILGLGDDPYIYFCPDSKIGGYKQICVSDSDFLNVKDTNFYVKNDKIFYLDPLDFETKIDAASIDSSNFITFYGWDKISGYDDKILAKFLDKKEIGSLPPALEISTSTN